MKFTVLITDPMTSNPYRTVPLTKEKCRPCHGKGCDLCDGRGFTEAPTVTDWLASQVWF